MAITAIIAITKSDGNNIFVLMTDGVGVAISAGVDVAVDAGVEAVVG